jgi:CcmD family protein
MSRVLTARVCGWVGALLVAGSIGAGSLAFAAAPVEQAPPAPAAQAASQDPQDQFVPLKSLPQQEQLPAATLLVGAYAFVWVVLLVYLWTIWRRLGQIDREMRQLSARVGEGAARH